ncbi:MAG: PH domain-containing protein [Clostridiales bacterium]|jgi:hypothetical protein|nr:PH domain-containing protein [Clostridiales bacterium]
MDNIIYFNTIIQPKNGTGSVSIIMVGILLIVVIPLIFLTFGIINAMKNTTLALTEKEIIIKSLFYGRRIPIENIIIDEIKQINLEKDIEYNISIRTNGISMPKFRSGWMRLKNGKKALTFITDKNNVVLIPTTDYILLFSMNNIDEFINKIKEQKNNDE